jgi:hypothetical protein
VAHVEETQPINGQPTEVAAEIAVGQLAEMRAELEAVKAELERLEQPDSGFQWDWEGFIRALAVVGAIAVLLAAVLTGD